MLGACSVELKLSFLHSYQMDASTSVIQYILFVCQGESFNRDVLTATYPNLGKHCWEVEHGKREKPFRFRCGPGSYS